MYGSSYVFLQRRKKYIIYLESTPESPAISHNERRPEALIQRLKTDFLALFPFQLTQNSNREQCTTYYLSQGSEISSKQLFGADSNAVKPGVDCSANVTCQAL